MLFKTLMLWAAVSCTLHAADLCQITRIVNHSNITFVIPGEKPVTVKSGETTEMKNCTLSTSLTLVPTDASKPTIVVTDTGKTWLKTDDEEDYCPELYVLSVKVGEQECYFYHAGDTRMEITDSSEGGIKFFVDDAISSGGRVTIDGFIPKSVGVGASPYNITVAVDTGPRRFFEIYLPEGYDNNQRYPVVYFLHGFGQNHTSYGDMFALLNHLIRTKAIQPIIVVKPDLSTLNGYLDSFGLNSPINGQFADYVANELRAYVNANYKTKPESTAITGHDSGAYGALLLSLKYPEIYRSTALHAADPLIALSAIFNNVDSYNGVKDELVEGALRPLNGPMSYRLYSRAAALSKVELPIEVKENKIALKKDVLSSWMANDPVTLIGKNKTLQNKLYMDVGDGDHPLVLLASKSFSAKLKELGIAHRFEILKGASFFCACPLDLRTLRSVYPILRKKEFLFNDICLAIGVDEAALRKATFPTLEPASIAKVGAENLVDGRLLDRVLDPKRLGIVTDCGTKELEASFKFHASQLK